MPRGDSLRTLSSYSNAKKNFRRGSSGSIWREPKKLVALVALLLVLCITESIRSTVTVLYEHNQQQRGDSSSSSSSSTTTRTALQKERIREPQCPVGLFHNATKRMNVNPACHPHTQALLHMDPIPTTKKITFLLIYYNDHHHLAHQIQSWKNFSQAALDQLQFLIVDDGSAEGHTAQEFLEANYEITKSMDIVIYNIEQDLLWNIGGARNLGFWMANTEWVFMSDGDIHVPRDTMEYVVRLTERPVENYVIHENGSGDEKELVNNKVRVSSGGGTTAGDGGDGGSSSANGTTTQYVSNVFVMFQRNRTSGLKPHPAVMLLPKSAYWYVGGCDEDFVGSYGYTDPHFRYKVEVDPTLHLIQTFPDMDERQIPPLVEMDDDIACPTTTTTTTTNNNNNNIMVCLPPFSGVKAPREVTRNQKLFFGKRGKGLWSNKVFRYTWHYVEWKKPQTWWNWLLSKN